MPRHVNGMNWTRASKSSETDERRCWSEARVRAADDKVFFEMDRTETDCHRWHGRSCFVL